MRTFLPLALGLMLAAPVAAQRMGSSNANAPTSSTTLEFADGTRVSCEYTAITWAKGTTMNAAADKDRGERTRTRINNTAKEAPLGEFTSSIALTVGDKTIPAGEYKLYFTITDKLGWQINFAGEKTTVTIDLPLQDMPVEQKRLLLGLYAGEGDGCGLYVAFGKQSCDLKLARGGKDKPSDGDKKGDH
jgi:hypothetical protein